MSKEEFDQQFNAIKQAFDEYQSTKAQSAVADVAGSETSAVGSSSGTNRTSRSLGGYKDGMLYINIYGLPDHVLGGATGQTQSSVGSAAGSMYGDGGPGWGQVLVDHVDNFVTGALESSLNMVYQPIAQVHDLGAVLYGLGYKAFTGHIYQPDYWSTTGKEAVSDADAWDHTTENLLASNPITGSALAGWNLGTAISNGDTKSIEMQLGGLTGGILLGKVGLEGEATATPARPPRIEPTIDWSKIPAEVSDRANSIDLHDLTSRSVKGNNAPPLSLDWRPSVPNSAPLGKNIWVDASEIRWSQESVSYAKSANAYRIQYNLDSLATEFQANPEAIPAIDVVRMPDGRLTALDNSRLTVRADQGGQIRTNIFAHDEVITDPKFASRFVDEAGSTPETYGQAALNRIGSQRSIFSQTYPFGSPLPPRVTGVPVGSYWGQYSEFPWLRQP